MSTASERTHSKLITNRFIQAVETITPEQRPKQRQTDVAKKLGIIPANYYRLKSKKNNYPTLDQCVSLCLKFKISAEWLMLGQGVMKNISKKVNATDLLKHAILLIEKSKEILEKYDGQQDGQHDGQQHDGRDGQHDGKHDGKQKGKEHWVDARKHLLKTKF